MKKRPFLLASLTVGGVFLFFLLVVLTAGVVQKGRVVVAVGNKIGVLEVEGVIADSRLLTERISAFREQGAIKAVVLRINSPGGSVAPSQEIYTELKRLAEAKPLVVSMGAVTASGGYYLALAGKRLFANPSTITGSIGVIMSFPNYQELMGKVGVKTEVVKSGRYKDIGSATKDFSAEDRQLLQEMIDDVHQQFVETVSAERGVSLERLRTLADGRIFTGRQALKIGLIDELGTFNDAVAYAAELSGIGGKPDLIYPEPEQRYFFERYLKNAASSLFGGGPGSARAVGPQYLWPRF